MRKITNILFASLAAVFVFAFCSTIKSANTDSRIENPVIEETVDVVLSAVSTYEPTEYVVISDITEETVSEEEIISQEDIELIALVTMAEAEGECEEGKRLVIDTILNRVDSKHFPDTIRDVIYQRNQFSVMWNGRINRCEVREDICQLVLEELESRTDYDVVFFTAGRYSKYGVPMFQVENHYFSSYD